MQNTAPDPRQIKLLGAYVHGLGVVTAVEANLRSYSYVIIEGETSQRVLIRDLERGAVTCPPRLVEDVKTTQHVDFGTWDEVYALIDSVAPAVALPIAA